MRVSNTVRLLGVHTEGGTHSPALPSGLAVEGVRREPGPWGSLRHTGTQRKTCTLHTCSNLIIQLQEDKQPGFYK